MSATLEIRESPDGLAIRVSEPRNVGGVLLTLLGGSFFLYILLHSSESKDRLLVFAGLAVLLLAIDIFARLRGTNVQLHVSNLDFISTGHAPEAYSPSTISRAEIYNMEFREAVGGGEGELPMGLYVEHHGGSHWSTGTCVLPNLDKAQTEQVIEAIYRRFPDTGTLPPSGPFEPYLTSLNLSATNKN